MLIPNSSAAYAIRGEEAKRGWRELDAWTFCSIEAPATNIVSDGPENSAKGLFFAAPDGREHRERSRHESAS